MAFATKVKETNDFRPFPRGLKDGNNRRRVLPGIHTCSEDGTWAKKYATHTYKVPREDDPEKFDYYTFHCVEVVDWVNREKVVLESCPECLIIVDQDEEFKRLQTKLKEELKSGQRTKDEVRKLLRPYIEWKKRHGRSFWWAINVKDGDGKYFTEKWPNDVKKQYDVLKKKLKDEDNIGAILPIDQGVWVDIVKTPGNESGTGFPEYKVDVTMERTTDGSKREKLAPLSDNEADDAEKSCWDISDPGVITLSREQVKQLASSGDAPNVLRGIFKQSTKQPTPKADSKPSTPPAAKTETPSAPKTETQPAAPKADPKPKAEETEDERIVREAEAAIAAAQARRFAAKKAELAPSAPPKADPPKAGPKPSEAPPKADPKPASKGNSVDEDLDSFMKEYELKDE